MALLEAQGISSGYGEMEILHGVSMQLNEGEIVAVLGPNGAGKSTLIKTIFGLLKPTAGKVTFAGRDVTGLAPEKIVVLGLSYVPQVNNVFPSLTVRENLEMGGIVLRRSVLSRILSSEAGSSTHPARPGESLDLDKQIKDVLGLFPGLQDRMKDRVGTLSGGQQHMVAFAKSLILEPQVLLIDEPSAGLAPNLVTMIFDKIREIREHGTSIVLVEQRARRALQLADRGYILDMGKNKFEDRGEALLRNPDIGRLYLGG